MTKSRTRFMVRTTVGLLPCTLALSLSGATSPSPASRDALDYAFKFASAIVSDPKDMGKAQEAVVWDLTSGGVWKDADDVEYVRLYQLRPVQ